MRQSAISTFHRLAVKRSENTPETATHTTSTSVGWYPRHMPTYSINSWPPRHIIIASDFGSAQDRKEHEEF